VAYASHPERRPPFVSCRQNIIGTLTGKFLKAGLQHFVEFGQPDRFRAFRGWKLLLLACMGALEGAMAYRLFDATGLNASIVVAGGPAG
jgi:hypothetical protein